MPGEPGKRYKRGVHSCLGYAFSCEFVLMLLSFRICVCYALVIDSVSLHRVEVVMSNQDLLFMGILEKFVVL